MTSIDTSLISAGENSYTGKGGLCIIIISMCQMTIGVNHLLRAALASLARSEDVKDCGMSAYKLSPKDPYLGRFFYLTMAMCAFVYRDNDKFLDWAEKLIQAVQNAPIRRVLMIAYASEINNYELAEQHFHHLRTTSPIFIESVLDGRNIVFSEQQSNKRLVKGLKVFLSTLS